MKFQNSLNYNFDQSMHAVKENSQCTVCTLAQGHHTQSAYTALNSVFSSVLAPRRIGLVRMPRMFANVSYKFCKCDQISLKITAFMMMKFTICVTMSTICCAENSSLQCFFPRMISFFRIFF